MPHIIPSVPALARPATEEGGVHLSGSSKVTSLGKGPQIVGEGQSSSFEQRGPNERCLIHREQYPSQTPCAQRQREALAWAGFVRAEGKDKDDKRRTGLVDPGGLVGWKSSAR